MTHARLLRSATVFYGGLALAGLGWVAWRGGWHGPPPAPPGPLLRGTAEGAAGGLAVVLLWAAAAGCATRLREFEESLAAYFRGLPLAAAAWLAFVSSVGEELLFRGGVQGSFGLWAASLAFGLAHVPLRRELIPWPVFAFAVGVLLGWLWERTGTLAAPIAGHFTINFVNLARMARSRA
jgi:membrane protease YdiL (CAAX protease family)